MSFDTLSGGRRKILMASDSGVLAAVNAASGKIGKYCELYTTFTLAVSTVLYYNVFDII